MITMNAITNNPVTTEGIEQAEHIFGPDIGSLKSKTTIRKPIPIAKDYIKIPIELTKQQRKTRYCHIAY